MLNSRDVNNYIHIPNITINKYVIIFPTFSL